MVFVTCCYQILCLKSDKDVGEIKMSFTLNMIRVLVDGVHISLLIDMTGKCKTSFTLVLQLCRKCTVYKYVCHDMQSLLAKLSFSRSNGPQGPKT